MAARVAAIKNHTIPIVEHPALFSCPILRLGDDPTLTNGLVESYWPVSWDSTPKPEAQSFQPLHGDKKLHFLDALDLSAVSEVSEPSDTTGPSPSPANPAIPTEPMQLRQVRTRAVPTAPQPNEHITNSRASALERRPEGKNDKPETVARASKSAIPKAQRSVPIAIQSKGKVETSIVTTTKRRKNKKVRAALNATADEIEKRERYLHRNRIAASKCRQRGKAHTSDLENRARVLSQQHKQLTEHSAGLHDEVLTLKNLLLMHVDCDCTKIREYLQKEAEHLAPPASIPYFPSNDRWSRKSK